MNFSVRSKVFDKNVIFTVTNGNDKYDIASMNNVNSNFYWDYKNLALFTGIPYIKLKLCLRNFVADRPYERMTSNLVKKDLITIINHVDDIKSLAKFEYLDDVPDTATGYYDISVLASMYDLMPKYGKYVNDNRVTLSGLYGDYAVYGAVQRLVESNFIKKSYNGLYEITGNGLFRLWQVNYITEFELKQLTE